MDSWFDNIIKNHYNNSLGFEWREYQVFNLYFKQHQVTADVSTGEGFYHVKITFRQFSVTEKDILESVANKNEVKRDLIRGIVPDTLFDSGVNIFPSSSIDIIVDCECWSGGFLCSEAMAVLNRLCTVFKRDPFLIFSLRGFDLTNIDSFPVKDFTEIFNREYNTRFKFLLDDYLNDYIETLLWDLEYLMDNYHFTPKDLKLNLPLNIDSNYQITNNNFENNGDFIRALKSTNNSILDYVFDLIKDYGIVPEIFRIDDGRVYTRWIPAVDLNIKINECLVKLNHENISRTDQVTVFASLIVEDLIAVMMEVEDDDYYFKSNLSGMLFKSTLLDSNRKKSLASDISRNLSIFTMKYNYQITIRDAGDAIELDFICDDDLDKLRYSCHIRKLFNYYKLYWNLNEPLRLDYKHYLKYLNHVEDYLDDLNVTVNKTFKLYDTTFRIRLELEESDFLTLDNISSSSWMIDLGNCLISTRDFEKLEIDDSGMVKINDDFYKIDAVKFNSLKSDLMFLPGSFESYELLQIALLGRYRNLKFDVGEEFKKLLDFQTRLPQPEGLKGELRPYQVTGYSWLVQNVKSGFGSILADDMGLGKTIQVLSAIQYFKDNNLLAGKQVLIIVPTTLILNWQIEIEKFTNLTYSVFHGEVREIDSEVDVILTSYGMIRSDEEKFKKANWFLCIVDEAQNIKNPNTKQTRAVKNIKADNRIALTGTPIENRLLDYWSIFDFTNQGYLNNMSRFKRDYVKPITRNPKSRVLDNLKIITKPFILRRLKSDRNIIDDLPDKNVNDIYCSLTQKQSRLYDELVSEGLSMLKSEEGIKRKGNILKLITSLKQVCNHPVQYLKKGTVNVKDSTKLELLVGIISNILDVDEKVIVFTQYVEMGKLIRKVLLKKFNREVLFLHGSLKRPEREKIINNFQNSKSYPILIATLKTGGVGLNLTSAGNVIHYDLWWNPAVENQATDRAYRIGQDKDVMVYRFITRGTLEEKIDLILKNKLELFNRTITSGETFITELDDDELKEILELRL